jgi:hypothetical protein
MSGVVTIGLDLAKSIFQIHGVDDAGRTMLRRRLSRHELVSYFAKMSPCLTGWRLVPLLTTGHANSLASAIPFG